MWDELLECSNKVDDDRALQCNICILNTHTLPTLKNTGNFKSYPIYTVAMKTLSTCRLRYTHVPIVCVMKKAQPISMQYSQE